MFRQKGVVIFSADFEMAWAFRYSKEKKEKAVEMGLLERKNVPQLLEVFDKHQIPVTWATVGHLFLNGCSRDSSGRLHPEMARPEHFDNRNWSFKTGDWYDQDPGSDVSTDPAWYAPDLIDCILAAKAGHEIACHTFSHLDFTYKNCPKELADAELDACMRLAENKSVCLKSMVFPGGTFGNFESLKERGFLCYRKPMRYRIDLPYIDQYGLVAIPSSLGLDRDPYGWSKEFHLRMVRKFLEKTVKYNLVCHFWFHPSMDQWYLDNVMPELIEMIAEFKHANAIRSITMADLAEEALKNACTSV